MVINIEVGILIRGSSSVEPIEGIELKRCLTYKQLAKYNIRLLENVKKEEIEQVKQLPKEGSTYSIGACDIAIKNITLYIKYLDDILNEKDAVVKEKEKSIKILKETTEKNVELENEINRQETNISELRDKIRELTIETDKNKSEIEKLTREKNAIQDKLSAETNLRIDVQKQLQNYKDNLGLALEETEDKIALKEQELTSEYTTEIDRIQKVIKEKEEIIQTKENKIEELTKINEELGKSGSIPEIPFTYNGKATIIGVCSKGSYGVSSFVYTLYKLISNKNCLIIDLDFKGGNLNNYIKSENRVIENMLKGGPLLKEHIISNHLGKVVDYIGGVTLDWTPYEILNLDWTQIFNENDNYDYIICDCGIYGGYNIQTKICEFIARLGKMIYIYKYEKDKLNNGFINIKNFANSLDGIPFVSRLISDNISLYDNNITRQYIQTALLNQIFSGEE